MRCELCDRETPRTTEHHLVPRARKRRQKKEFGPTADLCRDCHRMLHATFDEATLGREYATIEKLRAAPEVAKYLDWIRKRPGATYFGARGKKAR